MFNMTEIKKKNKEDKVLKTNCFDCEIMLTKETMKEGPGEGDKRLFCKKDWKKRFGKKKKLKKRH